MLNKFIAVINRHIHNYIRITSGSSTARSDMTSDWDRVAYAYFSLLFSTAGLVSSILLIFFLLNKENNGEALLLVFWYLSVTVFIVFRSVNVKLRVNLTLLTFYLASAVSLFVFSTPVAGIIMLFLSGMLSALFMGNRGLFLSMAVKLLLIGTYISFYYSGHQLFDQYNYNDFLLLAFAFVGIGAGAAIPVVLFRQLVIRTLAVSTQYRKLLSARQQDLFIATAKAKESDMLKNAFLANMSHEIRTPMNAILGFSHIIHNQDICVSEKQHFVELINQNGRNLMMLLDNIIDISKIDAGQLEIKSTHCDVNSILTDIHAHFQNEAMRKTCGKLVVTLNIVSKDELMIVVDAQRLRQVLFQLIGNAVKFTDSGVVEFGYSLSADEILFYVKDTGVGIPKGMEDEVFKRFSKFNDNQNRLFGGIGIGLSIAQNLVELMGGRIWNDRTIDSGAIFYFTLPYNPVEVNVRNTCVNSIMPIRFDWEGKTFLVAEDEEDNFRYIEVVLSMSNAQLLWARNGNEAIKIFRSKKNIDLVLMDIKMPGLDGYSATKLIRQMSDVPVIAQSAYTFSDEKDRLMKAGCDDFIEKPIGFNNLLYTIHKHVPSN